MRLDKPYPFLIGTYNRLFRTPQLDYRSILKKARAKVPDVAFDHEFEQRMERLCTAINEEASLHPFGAFILKERLSGLSINRLRALKLLEKQPDIRQIGLKPLVFITGLQRTGTTFLQRLLAADPAHRALLSWEALNPIPLNQKNERQKRIRMAKLSQRALKYISPVFFSIHPVEYNSPEEEILLNDMTLLSAVHEATLHVPSYAQWVTQQDHSPAYAWMYSMLQVLQYQSEAKTWILKTPQHLEYMDLIMQQYPNATVIHTHRNPEECLTSFCSMVYHSRKVFSDKVDPREVAQHWLQKNAYMLQKTINARKAHPEYRVIDIYYNDLVSNPMNTIKKIYSEIGWAWTSDIDNCMAKALKRNKKDKYGQHRYEMRDFGLTPEKIQQEFEFYIQHYFPNSIA